MQKTNEIMLLGYITKEKHMSERVIYEEGVCFTVLAMTHGYGMGFIMETSDK